MKSQVNAVWIAGASMLAIIGVLSFSLAYQVQSVVRGQNERTIIEAINEMEFVKKAIPHAAVYSSYQAAYETLKYGGYSTQGCTPEKFNNLPYWKVNDNECFPNNLDQDLTQDLKKIMSEYLKDLKEKASKIKIEIPEYQSMAVEIKGDQINVQASANEKIKFRIEGLELSDSPNIKTTVKLRIGDLVNKGIEIFRDKNPVKEQIVLAEQSISNACKKISYEKCFNPFTTSIKKTKKELLDATCPNVLVDFEDSIKKNILGLNSKFDTKDIDVTLTTDNDLIQANVDSDKENCEEKKQPDFRGKLSDASTCDCIRWVCGISNPVVVGDEKRTRILVEQIVNPDETCAPCTNIKDNICEQFTTKICLEGTPQNGNCKIETEPCTVGKYSFSTKDCRFSAFCSSGKLDTTTDKCVIKPPDCPKGGTYVSEENNCVLIAPFEKGCPDDGFAKACSGAECTCRTGDACSSGKLDVITDVCVTGNPTCFGEDYDSASDNCKSPASCFPDSTGKCVSFVDKECPPGTKEFENTGRCYSKSRASPTCALKETLYTKVCEYKYTAEANVLVNVEDTIKENKYPVYDSVEQKTDFRNLELQFYVLSKS